MSDYQGNIVIKNPATPTGPSTYGRAPGMWKLNEVAYWIKQGVWPNPAIVPDQYFPYVSLLLSTTSLGNANNNLFVDSSGAFNPVSRNGNTTQGSFTPYSTNWSNYFDGTGDYLSVSPTALSTGDFTFECWIYPTSTGQYQYFYDTRASVNDAAGFCVIYNHASYPNQISIYSNGFIGTPTITVSANTWTHFALVRSGGSWRTFVNGVADISPTSVSRTLSNTALKIGTGQALDYFFTGYMSNYRVVNGTAVYTSNFTVPTTPLTAISGTSLLTCQSNRFRDASSNNFTITPAGDTRVTDFGPFSPSTYAPIAYNQSDITNWSGYFDGSGDFLAIADNAAFDFGTGDFTIECWVYLNAYNPTFGSEIFSAHTFGVSADYIFNINTTGKLFFQIGSSSSLFTSTNSVPLNQWTHIAVVRSGNTFTPYINGVNAGGAATSSSAVNASRTLTIGSDLTGNAGASLNGYISNHRVVKGTAVYTSNFTPPTTPLTAISGTSLLTCQNAAFTDNSTNNFVITPNGNTTVTGNSPFNTVGYWSNYFSSTNSYLTGNAPLSTSTSMSTFTIEGWVYPTSFSDRIDVIGDMSPTSASDTKVIAAEVNTSGQVALYWFDGAVRRCTGNTAMVLNQWNYFAIVVTSNAIAIYVNKTTADTLSGTTTLTNRTQSANCALGKYYTSNSAICYLSNIRVSTVARTISSVPTAPLTADGNTRILTCQANRFVDTAGTVTFTPTTVSVQPYNPFYTATIASNGGSMYFASTGSDVLTFPSTPLVDVSTSSFTFECWVYFNGFGSDKKYIIQISGGNYWQLVQDSSFGISLRVTGYSEIVGQGSNSGWITGQWYHVALVRNGNSWNIYRNGVSIASATNSSSIGYYSPTYIGNYSSGNSINGYMTDVRITRSAVYTGAFTPPTAPLTPSANTTLLVNGMNAGIYDATAINDMETVGNAQVTTAVSKYGGSSVYFDGSGDYLVSRGNTILLGSGNFTVEFWVYFNAVNNGTVKYLYDFRTASATSASFLAQEASNAWTYWNGAGSSVTTGLSGSTFATGQWYHVAITRSSNVLYCFVNGTKVSSDPADSSNYASATMTLGARYSGSDGLNGYIDDVRLTAGVARYTSNFTPPTQAFPVY